MIPMSIIIAFGIIKFMDIFKKYGYFLLFIFYFIGLVRFLDQYFVHLPEHGSEYWDYGYREIVRTITPIQKDFVSMNHI